MRGVNLTIGKVEEEKKQIESVRTGLNEDINSQFLLYCSVCKKGLNVIPAEITGSFYVEPCECTK